MVLVGALAILQAVPVKYIVPVVEVEAVPVKYTFSLGSDV